MNFPEDLLYTEHDEWVRLDGDTLTVGLTDHAQDALGELVHLELPEPGTELAVGDMACTVESVKAVAEVYAPVAGTVVEVHDHLLDAVESINEDPYGSWLFKLKVDDPAAVEVFMDAAAYRAKVDAG